MNIKRLIRLGYIDKFMQLYHERRQHYLKNKELILKLLETFPQYVSPQYLNEYPS